MDESPRELVERTQRGDRSAFTELVRLSERSALAIAYAITRDSSAAGDVTQEAFLRVWQQIGRLDDPERFRGWLGRIVRNLATDHLRRRPREISPERYPRLVVDPIEQVEQQDRRSQINAALAELDEMTRAAVSLRYYQGLSSREIAELLEMTPAAIDMRLSRARTELKEKLGSLDPNTKCPT